MHCFGETLDTTFMLDYYENNDSVMVCLTGNDFTTMYGHRLGEGHHSSDEHFGGFDMNERSFTYSFRMVEGSTPYYLNSREVKE